TRSDHPIRVACTEPPGGPRDAVLLGPAIFGGAGVVSVRAVEPSAGDAQWTLSITLDRQAAAAWTAYTRAHHASGEPGGVDATNCASTGVPCADFVAFVADGQVLTLPLTLATLGSHLQLAGGFTEEQATRLAREL